MHLSRRCGARTRNGSPCRSAAMPNGRCRMHGGMSPGAPKGNKNAFKHGHYTAEAIASRGVRLRSCCAIAGVGLDRRTGLFPRIDPLLQACIPANPPTEQDVQDALVFLCDEWLVDVALDPVGKAVGVMLAMALIEGTLLA